MKLNLTLVDTDITIKAGLLSYFNPIALRKAKSVYNFGLSKCKRVKIRSVDVASVKMVLDDSSFHILALFQNLVNFSVIILFFLKCNLFNCS